MARVSRNVGLTVASRTFFREMSRYQTMRKGFHMLASGGSPDSLTDPKTFKAQSRSGAPVVVVNDLTTRFSNEGATTVRLEQIHDVYGVSTVGDADTEGTEGQVSSATFDITVEQHAKSLKDIGVMGKLRKNYRTQQLIRPALKHWGMTHMSERAMYVAAGARGDFYSTGMNLPPAGDPRLASQFENGLQAPTYDRVIRAGGHTTVADFTSADTFELALIDELRYKLDTDEHPIRELDLTDEALQESMPTHLILPSAAQWKTLMDSDGAAIKQMIRESRARTANWNHPIFKLGNGFMYEDFWIMKNFLPIRFMAGSSVQEAANDKAATESAVTVPANITVDRALVLGGAAVGMAFAASESGKGQLVYRERDIGYRTKGTEVAYVNGCKKIRFEDRDGWQRDTGVMVIDSVVTP